MIDLSYAEQTIDSKNPLKRFSHRNRFGQMLSLINEINPKSIFDYGSADGFLFLFGEEALKGTDLTLFEPVSHEDTLANFPPEKARVITSFEDLDQLSEQFDLVICQEVLEHLADDIQPPAFANFARLCKPGGHLIISVPIEIGLSSAIKNTFRLLRFGGHGGHPDETIGNAIRCLFGKTENISRHAEDDGFIACHVGFDYRELFKKFSDYEHVKTVHSPLPWQSRFMNSQITWIFRKTA